MSSPPGHTLFDPTPFWPSLALIRIPRNLKTAGAHPDPKDEFGTGFFITTSGILLTVVHNLTRNGKPTGRLLP
jgi:hypothetical protein